MEQQFFEIVRAEYFSGAHEPIITIRNRIIRFSAYCLNKLPDVDYVHFIIYPLEKRLVIEPCSPDMRDAIRWSSKNPENRKPKSIRSNVFYQKLLSLMKWHDDCRYSILGKITKDSEKTVIAFDLNSALVYRPDVYGKISRIPEYPSNWGDGFGLPKDEYFNTPLVKRFSENIEIIPEFITGYKKPDENTGELYEF